jgi:DNA segregation ATPase FtsK/SpoIIIE-like protein
MSDHQDILNSIQEIAANQQSLHDDMTAVVDRLDALQKSIEAHVQSTPEVPAVDIHQQYLAARALVVEVGKCSTSFLQRILRIGYSNAARLVDLLEENGVVGPQDGSRPRVVLITLDTLEELENSEYEATERQWELQNPNADNNSATDDELYEEAKMAVIEAGKASTSYLQRKLRIGYSRSARLMDMLEENGVIGPADGSKPREVAKE